MRVQNQSASPPPILEPAPASTSARRRKFPTTLFFLALVGGGLLCFLPRSSSPAVVVTGLPPGWPTRERSWSDKALGALPMWVWRFKETLLGPKQRVLIRASIIDCSGLSNAPISAGLLGGPHFTGSNGMEVWLLGDTELQALRGSLAQTAGNTVLSRPSIDTADGVEAQLFAGQSVPGAPSLVQVGLVINCLPRVRSGSIDLRAIVCSSEVVSKEQAGETGLADRGTAVVRTNLAVATRIQLPAGQGVFLLDGAHEQPGGKRLGVVISASVPVRTK